jgi:hypothetical protein
MSRFNHVRSIEEAFPLLLIMILSIPLSISAKEELLIDSCGVKQQVNQVLLSRCRTQWFSTVVDVGDLLITEKQNLTNNLVFW